MSSGGAGERELGAGDGALEQDLAAEAVELGRTAAGAGRHGARLFHQALLIDQAAEILLVQAASGQRFDRELERILSQQARGARLKPILEINLRHPLVAAIAGAGGDKAKSDDLSLLLLEQAQILDGELPDDPAAFTARLNRLVLQGAA